MGDYFTPSWRLESRSRCQQSQSPLGFSRMSACRHPHSLPSVCVCILISSSKGHQSEGFRAHPVTSTLTTKMLSPNTDYILRSLAQASRDTPQSITENKAVSRSLMLPAVMSQESALCGKKKSLAPIITCNHLPTDGAFREQLRALAWPGPLSPEPGKSPEEDRLGSRGQENMGKYGALDTYYGGGICLSSREGRA